MGVQMLKYERALNMEAVWGRDRDDGRRLEVLLLQAPKQLNRDHPCCLT